MTQPRAKKKPATKTASKARATASASLDKPQIQRDPHLDRVIDFVGFVAKPMPLSLLLDEAPVRIAAIIGADIASLYLLEGDGGELVLRGNVGFPQRARGNVRLGVGQGITGMAVESMRPISVVRAAGHERYVPFPELGEDRYPVFLAVPILGPQGPLGALVVQRSGDQAFQLADVRLAAALTAPIAAGIRHAQLLDDHRQKTHSRKAGGGTRKITLPGVPIVHGRALGAIAAIRRPAATAQKKTTADDPRLLRTAFDVAEKALSALSARARTLGVGDASFLANHMLMIEDARLRERCFELVAGGQSVGQALGGVAREAARAANGIVGDPFLQDRARDMEDLCDALLMLATPDQRAELPSKAVLLGDQLGVFDLLVSARAHPVGVVLTERRPSPRTRVLLQLLGVPSIADVGGAFRWASPGDVALLDADHGFLIINPSRAEVAAVRAERREGRPRSEAQGADEATNDEA